MKHAAFVAEARREFLAEVAFYNDTEPDLGARFARAVEEAAARALAFPDAGSPYVANTRRVFTNTFESEKAVSEDGTWRHIRVLLKPINRDFQPIELTCDDEGNVEVIAEMLEVLG